MMFVTGDGVPQDLVTGQKWFILASEHGYPLSVSDRDHYVTVMSRMDMLMAEHRAAYCRASQFADCD